MADPPLPRQLIPAPGEYRGTRLRILEQATDAFSTKGFHGTSMREIATAVGIRPASLYEHFPSKDHILAAILTLGFDYAKQRVADAVAAAGDGVEAQMAAAIRAIIEHNSWYPELTTAANSELRCLSGDHVAGPHAARDEVSLLLGGIIQRGMDEGVFPRRNIVLLVAAIGAMCLRTPYWFAPSGDYGVDDLADEYAELIVAMLRSDTISLPSR